MTYTQSALTTEPRSQSELEQHLWEAANILRGPVDAADFKTYIFPLLFYKRICDVYDEEYQQALAESGADLEYARFDEHHRFRIPDGQHWRDVCSQPKNLGYVVQKALREIEKVNQRRLYGIFGDAQWSNTDRLPDSVMRQLLDHFSQIRMGNRDVRDDRMGQAYEYLIKKFADSANKKAGEFYTPRTVVRLMINLLDPQPGESIYDPACGTGGMLLEAVQHVRERGEWRNLVMRGQEKNLTTQSIAWMNLLLHDIEDFDILRGDTLREPAFHVHDALETFDCVVSNPPFSLSQWGRDRWLADPYRRNRFGLPPQSNGDYAWVMHMVTSMHPQRGRVAVVLPHGALFRAGQEAAIRQRLLAEGMLDAVIGLGPNLFYGTGIPAAILVFRAGRAATEQQHVLFVDASSIYTKGRAQNSVSVEQADQIYALYQARTDVPGLVRRVPMDEIIANDHNLNIARYVQRQQDETGISVPEALAALQAKLAVQEEKEEQVAELLRREGMMP